MTGTRDSVARQQSPFPHILGDLVATVGYKPGWLFDLDDIDRGQGSVGLTLRIRIGPPDAYHPASRRPVDHYMTVPPAAYDERSWRRWLFDQILLVERHEAMEFFQVSDERPYAPSHGPGNDPYLIREVGTDVDVRTAYTGAVNG